MSDLISIVIPMYFEELVAEECYNRLSHVLQAGGFSYELVFVNDGSTDGTMDILEGLAKKDRHVKVVSLSRNFGHQVAVTAGIDKARGAAIIIIDADLQDPPELIPRMIELWKSGYDVVYAKRKKRHGETWFKRFTAKVFYRLLGSMAHVPIPADTGDFRLIDRKVAEAFKSMPERNRFVRGMMSWVGFRQIPVEYERDERFAGVTKYPLRKMLRFAMDGILSFSARPLKMVEQLGLWTVLAALGIFIYSLVSKAAGREHLVSGWTSLMTTITFLGGVQLLSIGVLGEYIARIYDESKGRPLYIVAREINTGELYAEQDAYGEPEEARKIV